jgi:hypothetical protein
MGDSLLTDFVRHWRSAESVQPEVLAVSGGTLAVCPAVEGAPRLRLFRGGARPGTRFGKIAVGRNDEPADVGEFATVHRYAVVGRGVRLLRLRSRFRWSPKVRYRAWNRGMAARRSRRCASHGSLAMKPRRFPPPWSIEEMKNRHKA